MISLKIFWILVAFYVIAKLCFFIAVYIVTKAVERRALREKKKRMENQQLYELEMLLKKKTLNKKKVNKDKELYQVRRKRYMG